MVGSFTGLTSSSFEHILVAFLYLLKCGLFQSARSVLSLLGPEISSKIWRYMIVNGPPPGWTLSQHQSSVPHLLWRSLITYRMSGDSIDQECTLKVEERTIAFTYLLTQLSGSDDADQANGHLSMESVQFFTELCDAFARKDDHMTFWNKQSPVGQVQIQILPPFVVRELRSCMMVGNASLTRELVLFLMADAFSQASTGIGAQLFLDIQESVCTCALDLVSSYPGVDHTRLSHLLSCVVPLDSPNVTSAFNLTSMSKAVVALEYLYNSICRALASSLFDCLYSHGVRGINMLTTANNAMFSASSSLRISRDMSRLLKTLPDSELSPFHLFMGQMMPLSCNDVMEYSRRAYSELIGSGDEVTRRRIALYNKFMVIARDTKKSVVGYLLEQCTKLSLSKRFAETEAILSMYPQLRPPLVIVLIDQLHSRHQIHYLYDVLHVVWEPYMSAYTSSLRSKSQLSSFNALVRACNIEMYNIKCALWLCRCMTMTGVVDSNHSTTIVRDTLASSVLTSLRAGEPFLTLAMPLIQAPLARTPNTQAMFETIQLEKELNHLVVSRPICDDDDSRYSVTVVSEFNAFYAMRHMYLYLWNERYTSKSADEGYYCTDQQGSEPYCGVHKHVHDSTDTENDCCLCMCYHGRIALSIGSHVRAISDPELKHGVLSTLLSAIFSRVDNSFVSSYYLLSHVLPVLAVVCDRGYPAYTQINDAMFRLRVFETLHLRRLVALRSKSLEDTTYSICQAHGDAYSTLSDVGMLKPHYVMPRMLSTPESMLVSCFQGDMYELGLQIISRYSLQSHILAEAMSTSSDVVDVDRVIESMVHPVMINNTIETDIRDNVMKWQSNIKQNDPLSAAWSSLLNRMTKNYEARGVVRQMPFGSPAPDSMVSLLSGVSIEQRVKEQALDDVLCKIVSETDPLSPVSLSKAIKALQGYARFSDDKLKHLLPVLRHLGSWTSLLTDAGLGHVLLDNPADVLISLCCVHGNFTLADELAALCGNVNLPLLVLSRLKPVEAIDNKPTQSTRKKRTASRSSNGTGSAVSTNDATYPLTDLTASYLLSKDPLIGSVALLVYGNPFDGTPSRINAPEKFPILQDWLKFKSSLVTKLSFIDVDDPDSDEISPARSEFQEYRDSLDTFPSENAAKSIIGTVFSSRSKVSHDKDRDTFEYGVELADDMLLAGAPDGFLRLIVEHKSVLGSLEDVWKYIIRLKDSSLAGTLVVKFIENWSLEDACHVTSYMKTRIDALDPNYKLMCILADDMTLYSDILTTVPKMKKDWQTLADECRTRPPVIIEKLLSVQQYDLAERVASSFGSHDDLNKRIVTSHMWYLVKNGQEARAMKMLGAMGDGAVPALRDFLERGPPLQTRISMLSFVVTYPTTVSIDSETKAEFERHLTGLKLLQMLPKALQDALSHLAPNPDLLVENLLMIEATHTLQAILPQFPSLLNESLMATYARKALSLDKLMAGSASPRVIEGNVFEDANALAALDAQGDLDGQAKVQSWMAGSMGASRNQDTEQAQLDEGTAIPLDTIPYILNVDDACNDEVRENHVYPRAPSVSLAKVLIDLLGEPLKCARYCLLFSEELSERLSMISADHHLMVIVSMQQLVSYAKQYLMMADASDMPNQVLELTNVKLAGPSVIMYCDTIITHIELLQQLVQNQFRYSVKLSDFSDEQKARLICETLVDEQRFELAMEVASKCQVEPRPVWHAWGLSLLKCGRYQQARDKLMYSLNGDALRLLDVLSVLEVPKPPGAGVLRKAFAAFRHHLYDDNDVDTFALPSTPAGVFIPSSFTNQSIPQTTTKNKKKDKDKEPEPTLPSSDLERLAISFLEQPDVPKVPTGSVCRVPMLDEGRMAECLYYLATYGDDKIKAEFYVKRDMYMDAINVAVDLKMIPASFLDSIFIPVLNGGGLNRLFDAIGQKDPNLDVLEEDLLACCQWLVKMKYDRTLYDVQLFMKDQYRAGISSVRLFTMSKSFAEAQGWLERVKRHFLEARETLRRWSKEKKTGPSRSHRHMNEMNIARHIKSVDLQMEILKVVERSGNALRDDDKVIGPHKWSIFESGARINTVAIDVLVLGSFELAIRIVQEYQLSSVEVYGTAVTQWCERNQVSKVLDLLKYLKGYVVEDDWDSIIMAAVNAIYGTNPDNADQRICEKLVPKLSTVNKQVEAWLVSGKLKSAYVTAVKAHSDECVQRVFEESQRLQNKGVMDLCQAHLQANVGVKKK